MRHSKYWTGGGGGGGNWASGRPRNEYFAGNRQQKVGFQKICLCNSDLNLQTVQAGNILLSVR